jgi:hypothetical protein
MTATRKLFLLHFPANALLLWLGYQWLGIAESTTLNLVASAAGAIAILALACWLHSTTLGFFRSGKGEEAGLAASFRAALGTLPAFVLAAMIVLALYGALAWAAGASGQPAFRLASWLTLTLRVAVKPATVAQVFLAGFWIVRWVVLPVALMPAACGIAARGWRGLTECTWRSNWRYWIAVPVLLLAGLVLPLLLVSWVPLTGGFALEILSFTVRTIVAYLLFICAVWILEVRTAERALGGATGAQAK